MKKRFVSIFRLFCLVSVAWFASAQAFAKDFTVVIDAGHGGHDPGAIGKVTREKNINLNVALRLGKKIETRFKDVKVVYTRKKDVFVPLDRRAEIANDAKADLFISIHTNSVAKGNVVRGTETYTLGLARLEANLEVAKRENSVILIENDYKQRYAGFNPNSSESYIMFEFIQDKHMEQSVSLAKLVQGQFRNYAKRVDRGVHQAGFLVLRATTMPSILIELGYISNQTEERYLNSAEGVESLSEGIYRAFKKYKEQHHEQPLLAMAGGKVIEDKPEQIEEKPARQGAVADNKPSVADVRRSESADVDEKPVFKVQILTSSRPLKKGAPQLKGLKNVDYYKENGIYKYTYGQSADYNRILRLKREVTGKFKDAFIIAFRNGEKMNVVEAIAEFKKNKK